MPKNIHYYVQPYSIRMASSVLFEGGGCLLSSWLDTLYTFWDNITHYKTESVHFWGLMNSATESFSGNPKARHGKLVEVQVRPQAEAPRNLKLFGFGGFRGFGFGGLGFGGFRV